MPLRPQRPLNATLRRHVGAGLVQGAQSEALQMVNPGGMIEAHRRIEGVHHRPGGLLMHPLLVMFHT